MGVVDFGGILFWREAGEGEEVVGGEAFGDGVFVRVAGVCDFAEGAQGGEGVFLGFGFGGEFEEFLAGVHVALEFAGGEEFGEVVFGGGDALGVEGAEEVVDARGLGEGVEVVVDVEGIGEEGIVRERRSDGATQRRRGLGRGLGGWGRG